jgi:hypothetical protein
VVLGLVAVDDEAGPDGEALAPEATADEHVGRAALDHPYLFLGIGRNDLLTAAHHALHREVDPGMGVHPLEAHDGALDLHGRVRVELGAEGVVGVGGRIRQRGERADGHAPADPLRHRSAHGQPPLVLLLGPFAFAR